LGGPYGSNIGESAQLSGYDTIAESSLDTFAGFNVTATCAMYYDLKSPVALASATDGAGGFDELDGAIAVSTWSVGSSVYAIVASVIDNGVQIIDETDTSSP
jgi:hypothetical protein